MPERPAIVKEMKELVMGAVTLWREKDFDTLDKFLKDNIYKHYPPNKIRNPYNEQRAYQFVTMLLEVTKYLEDLIAEELDKPVEEIHSRLAMLVATDDI